MRVNVVIHEFAHKLDMLNGEADGMPPLHSGMAREQWLEVFDAAFEGFCDAVEPAGRPGSIPTPPSTQRSSSPW